MKRTEATEMVLPVHRLTPYLHLRIFTDDHSLAIEHRRAPFGLIPLWTHRTAIPLTDLASARVTTNVRLQCLATAGALVATIFLLDLPVAVRMVLGIVGLMELLLALAPRKAVRIERTDGRSWTVPFCWAYTFDASLALEDAQQRRDAQRSKAFPVAGSTEGTRQQVPIRSPVRVGPGPVRVHDHAG